jgi:hypothetical protein
MKPGDKFRCSCGREQAYQPVGKNGGCTEDEARHIGWSQIDTGEVPLSVLHAWWRSEA